MTTLLEKSEAMVKTQRQREVAAIAVAQAILAAPTAKVGRRENTKIGSAQREVAAIAAAQAILATPTAKVGRRDNIKRGRTQRRDNAKRGRTQREVAAIAAAQAILAAPTANVGRRDNTKRGRTLGTEDYNRIKEEMEEGDDEDIIWDQGTDPCNRHDFRTLIDGEWLNDAIIHTYLQLLEAREERLAQRDPNRKRSLYFKSFFETQLNARWDTARPDQYTFANVKRWSRSKLRRLQGKRRT